MKPTSTVVVFSYVVLCLIAAKSALGARQYPSLNLPVYDSEFNEVTVGNEYYLISNPLLWPSGGLIPSRFENQKCPLGVAHQLLLRGLPLAFSPGNNDETVVRVSTDVNVKFAVSQSKWEKLTGCNESSVLKVGELDEPTGQRFLVTGGVEGNYGSDTFFNWFKFELVQSSPFYIYKLVFCPSIVPFRCRNVSVYSDGNSGRLVVSEGDPFIFRLDKKEGTANAKVASAIR